MLITDLDLAQACWNLYYDPSKIDSVVAVDGVTIGITHAADHSIICFRGSTTDIDWLRDFQSQMLPDVELGGVECGFIQGLREIIGTRPMGSIPTQPIYITGHSLGAARALIFAALETLKGLPIEGVVVFGSPRPGSAKIKQILADVPVRLYKNRNDPVCDVPFDIPLLDPYVHVGPLIELDCAPPVNDLWGIFADHHMSLYLKALQLLSEPC